MAIAEEAQRVAAREYELDGSALVALETAAEQMARACSESNLGYQANVATSAVYGTQAGNGQRLAMARRGDTGPPHSMD